MSDRDWDDLSVLAETQTRESFLIFPPKTQKSHKNYWDNEEDWGRFRYFWDYAGGYVTDWFTHWLDIVQPAMNVKFPDSVVALGGRYHLQDNGETADTLQAVLEYDGFIVTYNLSCNPQKGFHSRCLL